MANLIKNDKTFEQGVAMTQYTTDMANKADRSEVANKSNKATEQEFTISTSAWSNNQATISNAFFVSTGYAYLLNPSPATREVYIDANIYPLDVTTNGQLVLMCETVPTDPITVRVNRSEVA